MTLSERQSAEYLERILTQFLPDWRMSRDNVSAVVTNNDSKMMKLNRSMLGYKIIIPFYAHTLNLIVAQSIEKST